MFVVNFIRGVATVPANTVYFHDYGDQQYLASQNKIYTMLAQKGVKKHHSMLGHMSIPSVLLYELRIEKFNVTFQYL